MNGVAVGANYVVQGVRRTLDVGFLQIFSVALEARFENLLGLHQREGVRDGVGASARCNVIFARTVAAFAACLIGRAVPGSNRLKVRIFIKAGPNICMADFTNVTSQVAFGGRGCLSGRRGCLSGGRGCLSVSVNGDHE